MFSPLRNRFGIPGVISVIALVFAMFGGAYAANNSSSGGKATASAKAKKGPRGPKGATGPAGPAGPAGLAGPAGAKGENGAAGQNGQDGAAGTSGTNGKTVLSGVAVPTAGVGTDGDFYIRTTTSQIWGPKGGVTPGSWGGVGPTDLKGATGSPWPGGGTLAPNATETGSFYAAIDATGEAVSAVSFNVPLAADIPEANLAVAPDPNCDDGSAPGPSPSHPEAAPGFFCVFKAGGGLFLSTIIKPGDVSTGGTNGGAGTTGAIIKGFDLLGDGSKSFYGTWAVTAAP